MNIITATEVVSTDGTQGFHAEYGQNDAGQWVVRGYDYELVGGQAVNSVGEFENVFATEAEAAADYALSVADATEA